MCWLPFDERIQVLDSLRSFLRDDGTLFATFPSGSQAETSVERKWLADSFDGFKIISYRRPITRSYETLLQYGVRTPKVGRLFQFLGAYASLVLSPFDEWPRLGKRNDLIIEGGGK